MSAEYENKCSLIAVSMIESHLFKYTMIDWMEVSGYAASSTGKGTCVLMGKATADVYLWPVVATPVHDNNNINSNINGLLSTSYAISGASVFRSANRISTAHTRPQFYNIISWSLPLLLWLWLWLLLLLLLTNYD